jgi:hypothetical protein
MASLSDAELLRIVNVEYKDYRSEAIECARAELDARGIAYSPLKSADQTVARTSRREDHIIEGSSENDETASEQDGTAEFKPSFCTVCGAQTRSGYLFAGRGEMTVVFSDNNEERFVELDACSKCGHVRLIIDFETDVAE